MIPKQVVIIGGGPGGYTAAIRAAQLGARAILIEEDRIGGTCLNRGCIPTKALLSDLRHLRSLKSSAVFQPLFSCAHEGYNLLKAMMDRKQKVVKEMVKGVETLLESQRVTLIRARGDLLASHQVVLLNGEKKGEVIEADAIILAPGSKPKMLPDISPDGDKMITSDEALEIKKIPREIVIMGGGYIGLEFATLFNVLGSRVTIVEILEDILPGLEGELVRNARRFLERDGVKILTESKVEDLCPEGEGLRLTVKTPRGVEELAAERVLVAVGRVPDLGLDFSRAGIKTTPAGIRVNDRMETSARHIYAAGDAIGGILLAHVAQEEGIVAAENAMGMNRQMEYDLIPACIFTFPEIASIGLTEKEAREKGAVKIGRFPFRSNPSALISGETDGLIKVVVSQDDDRIMGVHIIGHEAPTLISIASALMRQGLNAREFSKWIQAHPTAPEGLREALLDVDGVAIHLPKPLRGHKR